VISSAMPKSPSLPVNSPHQSGPTDSRLGPPPFHHFSRSQHGLDAEHMIGGHPVFQAMRAARVEGDVATDRANGLARRIRRVMQPMHRGSLGHVQVHHARFDHGEALRRIEFQDSVEPVSGR